jgi:hypothetical protein
MLLAHRRTEVRPGFMGQPLPGYSYAVLDHDRDEPAPAGTPGRIAVDITASPLALLHPVPRQHGPRRAVHPRRALVADRRCSARGTHRRDESTRHLLPADAHDLAQRS